MFSIVKNIRRIDAGEFLVPGFMIASLLVMFFNLPGPVMDWLLSFNIALSVLILLTTFFVQRPLEFSLFPTLLLATTLFRLALNIGTTRLILTRADQEGVQAAGGVVRAFAQFVSADSLVVGAVIFAIFVIIQFVVITKGATRISEVAARFTLDALPGRQMSIDADLAAGLIDAQTARERREELTDQTDFFGAMDGAGKFVRGDAIAGLIIIAVNVIGGVLIGTLQHGRPLGETFATYTTLTVGDGLVSQVPALLISMATGVLVSRSSRKNNLSKSLIGQFLTSPFPFVLAGIFLLILPMTGLPFFPLLILATSCFAIAWRLTLDKRQEEQERQARERSQEDQKKVTQKNETAEKLLCVDAVQLKIGLGLVRAIQNDPELSMTDRFARLRRKMAFEWGILLPKVRVRDDLQLDENRFSVQMAGMTVLEGMVRTEMLFAVDTLHSGGKLSGIRTKDPVTDATAYWIEEKERENAELLGFEVISPLDALMKMFYCAMISHADELLTRDMFEKLMTELRLSAPAVVNDLIPNSLKPSVVLRVLRRLLREGVSIRPLGTIFEALSDVAERSQNSLVLCDAVRVRLGRMIVDRYRDADGQLRVLQLDPVWEEKIRERTSVREDEIQVDLTPDESEELSTRIRLLVKEASESGEPVVLLVSPTIRSAVRELTETILPRLPILSYNEIPGKVELISEGIVCRRAVAA